MSGSIWLFGCGNMGGAMLRRWIGAGIDPASVTVIDRGAPDVPDGVRVMASVPRDARPETLVLAVKPQQLGDAEAALADTDLGTAMVLSILAGVEEAVLRERLRAGTVVRAMPNLPVAIGVGVVALHSTSRDAAARDRAEALCRPLGLVEWIETEALFDAVTALSGCGPGFVYRFIDALAEAGAALGLPRDQALRLATATVEGSALLAARSDEPPATLADRVASPGGSTREGLNVLDKGDVLKRLLAATLAASAKRNAELAKAAR